MTLRRWDANDYHYIMKRGVCSNKTGPNQDVPTFGSTAWDRQSLLHGDMPILFELSD